MPFNNKIVHICLAPWMEQAECGKAFSKSAGGRIELSRRKWLALPKEKKCKMCRSAMEPFYTNLKGI